MGYKTKNRDEHLLNDGQPKRILALDGGGLRGILTLGILQRIEDILRKKHGNSPDFRLCHYFDLIAGTSTGSIIAAGLALGWNVEEIYKKYIDLGNKVFQKDLLRQGWVRAIYDETKLIEELQQAYGKDTLLNSDKLQTGLLIMTKRLDTGSPWPISNNPKGKYFNNIDGSFIGNGDYPLWQVVRASTAAPRYFESQTITIAEKEGYPAVEGEFVDGGVSPFNNPAFQAFMYATLAGYNINWQKGEDKLLLVSVGTGLPDPAVERKITAIGHAFHSLLSLMKDCATLQEILLQGISRSDTVRTIDREIETASGEMLYNKPLLTYLRYDVDFKEESIQKLYPELTDREEIKSLSEMDIPENMDILHKLGKKAGERDVKESHFIDIFNLSEK